MANLTADRLLDEAAIVWLEPIDGLDYVRETLELLHFRARPPRRPNPKYTDRSRFVGYAVLRPDAPAYTRGYFMRRVFWLKDHDRHTGTGPYRKGGAPCEAVDPRTVAAGKPGEMTERAWGRPLKTSEADAGR